MLNADRVRVVHLHKDNPVHTVWAREDSTGRAYFTGVYPVKFFEKDSEVDLTGAQSLPR